ncbi:MAG: TIGR00269 family protein [Candidatus Verstraetearchaeota archaeon]|nr:TIGR00269 family protein [Candidatus Verstraetearchaeota archaeon]
MQCNKCGNIAAYFNKISGVALCKKCFMKSIEEKVRWTIGKYGLFEWNDHILLAVSGGKDSLVMMKIIAEIEREFPQSTLIAVTIDEGIKNYREIGLKLAKKYAEKFGVEHEIYSFKKFYGYSLSEIVEKAYEKKLPHHPCTYCGVLRRKLLNVKGKELGATKIATAHNLDDEAQTILMNILRGDVERLIRLLRAENTKIPGFIPRVKPMQLIPESELALYAYYSNIELYSVDCPYSHTSLRDEIRRFLNIFEKKHPGAKYSIYSSFRKISQKLVKNMVEIEFKRCKYCGEPTTRELCRACELLEQLGLI